MARYKYETWAIQGAENSIKHYEKLIEQAERDLFSAKTGLERARREQADIHRYFTVGPGKKRLPPPRQAGEESRP